MVESSELLQMRLVCQETCKTSHQWEAQFQQNESFSKEDCSSPDVLKRDLTLAWTVFSYTAVNFVMQPWINEVTTREQETRRERSHNSFSSEELRVSICKCHLVRYTVHTAKILSSLANNNTATFRFSSMSQAVNIHIPSNFYYCLKPWIIDIWSTRVLHVSMLSTCSYVYSLSSLLSHK